MPPTVTDLKFVPTTDPALEARVSTSLHPDDPLTPEMIGHWWESAQRMGSFEHYAIRSGSTTSSKSSG